MKTERRPLRHVGLRRQTVNEDPARAGEAPLRGGVKRADGDELQQSDRLPDNANHCSAQRRRNRVSAPGKRYRGDGVTTTLELDAEGVAQVAVDSSARGLARLSTAAIVSEPRWDALLACR